MTYQIADPSLVVARRIEATRRFHLRVAEAYEKAGRKKDAEAARAAAERMLGRP